MFFVFGGGGGGGGSMSIGGAISAGTVGSVLFVGTGPTLAQNNANFFWDDTSSRLGLLTSTPTASLTLGSTSTGYAHHNQVDQTTNYERHVQRWAANVFSIGNESGGTGTVRSLVLGVAASVGGLLPAGRVITIGGVAPFFNLNFGATGQLGNMFDYTGSSFTASSGQQTVLAINPTINQSGTASYTGLLVNPTHTAAGAGTRTLADFQLAGTTALLFGAPSAQIAWATNGIAISQRAGTWTDNSTATSGTVALSGINAFGAPTIGASNATVTYTDAATVYIAAAPAAGTNVTIARPHALYVASGFITGLGGLRTTNAGNSPVDNFFVSGGTAPIVGVGVSQLFVEGATTTSFRASFVGNNANTISANSNYALAAFGSSSITEATSGNHPLLSTAIFKAPTITGGVATVSNTATVYIEGAPSATVTGFNYALWVKGNLSKFAATAGTHTADTDAATITFDMNVSNYHAVTLGGNRTLAVSNTVAGQAFTILLKQDATGSRTVTWFGSILWAGGTVPTLTTTVNKTDVFTFYYDGTNYYGGIVGQNY